MKLRIATTQQEVGPLAGGTAGQSLLEVSMAVPDKASDEEIAAAAARLTRAHRVASIERYWETRAILVENGVDPDAGADDQLEQATDEAERRGGHL